LRPGRLIAQKICEKIKLDTGSVIVRMPEERGSTSEPEGSADNEDNHEEDHSGSGSGDGNDTDDTDDDFI